jgi:cytoskeletal protein CcmA (bactofilin family)
MPREATKAEKHTLIEQGTEFKGTMKSTCPVVVNGRIEGELSAPELDVTTTGTVQGTIKAERLSSRGVLSGNVDAGDLFLSGSVGSKTVIKAKNLEVKLAPDQGRMELTIGECTLDVGDEPTRERRVEPSSKSAQSGGYPAAQASEVPSPTLARDESAQATPSGAAEFAALADGRASKNGSTHMSKPPTSKKSGTRDSVPPDAE